jgi:hypothetical protein
MYMYSGGAMGAGHSELGNRFVYLKACFWSFYEFFPHIVAGTLLYIYTYVHIYMYIYIYIYG